MVDRTIPWADDGTTPNYFTGEGGSDPPDGNFVVAETAAGVKLLEWDDTASEWVVRGDVNASGQSMAVDTLNATAVSTERLVSDRIYAGAFDGTDADARLDAALSAASAGNIIYLEKETYTSDRTISPAVTLIGVSRGVVSDGSTIDATWTLSERADLQSISVTDPSVINIETTNIAAEKLTASGTIADININSDRAILRAIRGSTVTFESGTSEGIIDSSSQVSVVDDGSNTVGDIA